MFETFHEHERFVNMFQHTAARLTTENHKPAFASLTMLFFFFCALYFALCPNDPTTWKRLHFLQKLLISY